MKGSKVIHGNRFQTDAARFACFDDAAGHMMGFAERHAVFTHKLSHITTTLHLLGIKSVVVGIVARLAMLLTETTIPLHTMVIKRDVQQGLDFAKRQIA